MGYQAVAAPGNVSAVRLDWQRMHFRALLHISRGKRNFYNKAIVFNIYGQNGTGGCKIS